MSTQISTDMPREKYGATPRKVSQQPNQPPQPEQFARQQNQQQASQTGLIWQKVTQGKEASKTKFEVTLSRDAVLTEMFADVLSMDLVDAPRKVESLSTQTFKETLVQRGFDSLVKHYGETFSHNLFMSFWAKMEVGIWVARLAVLGVPMEEIEKIIKKERHKKAKAIRVGLAQVISDKVLLSITTGARI